MLTFENIAHLINQVSQFVSNYVTVFPLFIIGLYLTFYSNFAQFRKMNHLFDFLYKKSDSSGDVSPIQTFILALGARIGLGNIIGVSAAIIYGGPGALFWMWITVFFVMIVSIFESTLAQMYKEKSSHDTGSVSGPVYYINKGLGGNFKILGSLSAVFLFVAMVFMNATQANIISSLYAQFIQDKFNEIGYFSNFDSVSLFSSIKIIVAIGLAFLFFLTVYQGLQRIIAFCDFFVPFMVVIYIALGIYACLSNYYILPSIFMMIIKSAFGFGPLVGGVAGYGIMQAINWGVRRALYSNEAGLGTIATLSTGKVDHPLEEGYSQTLGLLLDTLIICSTTGFIILTANYPDSLIALNEVAQATGQQKEALLVVTSLKYHFGNWAEYLLLFCAALFSFTSLIGNYQVGVVNLVYFFNDKETKNFVVYIYQAIIITMIMVASIISIKTAINLTDIVLAFCMLFNLLGIFLLRHQVMEKIEEYYFNPTSTIDNNASETNKNKIKKDQKKD